MRIAKAKGLTAKLLTQGIFVEGEADVESAFQGRLNISQLRLTKALLPQALVINVWRPVQGGVADRVFDDGVDLAAIVAQGHERGRDHAVDDLKIATARQLFELDQSKIGLDARGIAIHYQTDCSRRRDHGCLGIAIAMPPAPLQRFVPGIYGGLDQPRVGTFGGG